MSEGNLCPQKQKEEHGGALVGQFRVSGGPVPGLCLGPIRMTAQSLRLQSLRKVSHVYVPKNEVLNSYFDT